MTDDGMTGVLDGARSECRRRVDAGHRLNEVERYIERLPVPQDARAALWLWAWTLDDRADDRERPRRGSGRWRQPDERA
jgi:hypothetical protein